MDVLDSSNADALQVVILLTDLDYISEDGSPTVEENQTVFQLWQNRRPGARLFIYDFGQNQPQNWSALACQVEGYYESLDNTAVAADARLSIQSLFNFLARSRVLANNNTLVPFWVPRYVDASGLGYFFTVSYPAMSADGLQLIGAAGIGFKFTGVDDAEDDSLSFQINAVLKSRSKMYETSISTYPAGAPIVCKQNGGNMNPYCAITPSNYEPLCTAPAVFDNKTLLGLSCGCPTSKLSRHWVILVSAIGGSAALFVILIFAVPIMRYIRRDRTETGKTFVDDLLSLTEYSYEELKRGTADFDEANFIGRGMFGVVYKGVVRNANVAVKQLKEPADRAQDFQAEMMTLRIAHHPNLVELKGYCFQPTECFLVYELVKSGDLESWLFPAKQSTGKIASVTVVTPERFLTWRHRRTIARGAARALKYLHHDLPVGQIFHLDIKPRNILLEEDFNPKIADFGISQIYAHGYTMEMLTCRCFTPGYVAPEVLSGIKPDSKLDVYSYGVVLLQLMSGRQLRDLQTGESLLEWARGQVERGHAGRVVDKRMVEREVKEYKKVVVEISKQMIVLALRCLSDDPPARPEMREVLDIIDNLNPIEEQLDASENSSDQPVFLRPHLQPSNGHPLVPSTEPLATLRSQLSYRRLSERNIHQGSESLDSSTSWDAAKQNHREEMSEQLYYDRSGHSSTSSPDRNAFETAPESPPRSQTRRSRKKKFRKPARVKF